MLTEQEQVERVREEIREEIRQLYWWSRQHPQPGETVDLEELTARFANKILSIDGLLIKSANQELPSILFETSDIMNEVMWTPRGVQQDMLNDNFVRVIKEKVDG